MTCQTSAGDVLACVSLSVGVFGVSLVPFFLLINAEHLVPRVVRELPANAAVSVAALLLLLSSPSAEVTR